MDNWITKSKMIAAGIAAASFLSLNIAHADPSSTQNNKNLWRNVTIGAGVIAAHGLLTHNGTEALVGAAGAAYSAHRYEQDRHHQSQQNAARDRAAELNHRYGSSTRRYYASNGHVYRYNSHTGSRTLVS